MSKDSTNTIATIAYSALDQLRASRESVIWLTALMRAIHTDMEYEKGSNVVALASLGQYIGLDCVSLLDNRTIELQKQLDALEAIRGSCLFSGSREQDRL
ncbi:hypothetical protein AAGT13_21385 [Azotobacter salinestris]